MLKNERMRNNRNLIFIEKKWRGKIFIREHFLSRVSNHPSSDELGYEKWFGNTRIERCVYAMYNTSSSQKRDIRIWGGGDRGRDGDVSELAARVTIGRRRFLTRGHLNTITRLRTWASVAFVKGYSVSVLGSNSSSQRRERERVPASSIDSFEQLSKC